MLSAPNVKDEYDYLRKMWPPQLGLLERVREARLGGACYAGSALPCATVRIGPVPLLRVRVKVTLQDPPMPVRGQRRYRLGVGCIRPYRTSILGEYTLMLMDPIMPAELALDLDAPPAYVSSGGPGKLALPPK